MQVVTTLRAFLSNSPEIATSFSSRAQLSRQNACLAWALRPTASTKGGVLVALLLLWHETVETAHETDGAHSPWDRRHHTSNTKHNLQASLTLNSVHISLSLSAHRPCQTVERRTNQKFKNYPFPLKDRHGYGNFDLFVFQQPDTVGEPRQSNYVVQRSKSARMLPYSVARCIIIPVGLEVSSVGL